MESLEETGSSAAVMILHLLMLSEKMKTSLCCSCFTQRFNETIEFMCHHLQTDYCGVDFIFILHCELLISSPSSCLLFSWKKYKLLLFEQVSMRKVIKVMEGNCYRFGSCG